MATTTTQYSQENRQMSLTTPLGTDVLLLQNLTYSEELGRPFEMILEMQSTNQEIDFSKILGQSVTVTIQMPQGSSGEASPRYLNGVVRKFKQVSFQDSDGLYSYSAVVVPEFAMLDLSSTCQCYEYETIPTIISQVFSAVNFSGYELNLTAEYSELRFSVQYCESPFAYVSRLMETAGITYYFQHAEGSHVMVLCDSTAAYTNFPGYGSITYNPVAGQDIDCISEWSLEGQTQTGSFALTDYDYTSPNTNLFNSAKAQQSYPWGDAQRFDYPAGCYTPSDVQTAATIRLQQLQCNQSTQHGAGRIHGISAGYTFTLAGFPRQDQNIAYLTTAAELTITSPPFNSVGETEDDMNYQTKFSVIPKTVPFRTEATTPKPFIGGVQTAVVVAPAGQASNMPYVSPYGSIKVQFHWNYNGPSNENSSIWIRVSQISAGSGWGSMFIPRPGNEVIVAFEQGDPDRPIIVGCVYNAMQMPPIALPTNNLLSYITDDGGNMIVINPASGNEFVHIYSPHMQSRHTIGASFM